jgi:hypothetical protein
VITVDERKEIDDGYGKRCQPARNRGVIRKGEHLLLRV